MTPPKKHYVLGHGNGRTCTLTPEDLRRHVAAIGESGAGKSDTLMGMTTYAAQVFPQSSIVILDGIRSVGRNVLLTLYAAVHRLRQKGKVDAADELAARLLYIRVDARHVTGPSVDLSKRGVIAGKQISVEQHAEMVMSILDHVDADAEIQELINEVGTAAVSVLSQAGRPLYQLEDLLSFGNTDFWAALKADVRAGFAREHGRPLALDHPVELHPSDPAYFLRAQWRVLSRLFTQKSQTQFDAQVGSTRRHFGFLTKTRAALFAPGGIDLLAFLDRGGIIVLEPGAGRVNDFRKVRRAFYGMRNTFIDLRPKDRFDLCVMDETFQVAASMILPYVTRARSTGNFHWFGFQAPTQIGKAGEDFWTLFAAAHWKMFFGVPNTTFAKELLARDKRITLTSRYLNEREYSAQASESESESERDGWSNDEGDAHGQRDQGGKEYRTIEGEHGSRRSEVILRDAGPQWSDTRTYRRSRSGDNARGRAKSRGRGVVHKRSRISVEEQRAALASHLLSMKVGQALHLVQGCAPVMIQHRYVPEPLKRPWADDALHLFIAEQRARFPEPPLYVPPEEPEPDDLDDAFLR